MNRIGELGFNPLAPLVGGLQLGERAASAALIGARDRERTLDPAPLRIRDDRARRDEFDLLGTPRQNGCSGGPRANSPSRTRTFGPR
jgi:hypothetical protein